MEKEIYEGDIVNFYPYELSNQEQRRSLLIRECEVIGNKYSNPELLKDMGVKHGTDKEEEE